MAGIPNNGKPKPRPPQHEQEIQITVLPQPVPMQYIVEQQPMPDGKLGVVLHMLTPLGQTIYFCPAEFAASLGAELTKAAGASRTNLIISS